MHPTGKNNRDEDAMASAQATAPQAAANENTLIDQDALDLEQLAKGVLARDFRPRVNSVRRLAEAVLERLEAPKQAGAKAASKPKKKKSAKSGKATNSSKAKKKKAGSKKRKLAKIPAQKGT